MSSTTTENLEKSLRKNAHSVTKLIAHLVFVVKYRHSVISEGVWNALNIGFSAAAQRIDVRIIESNHDKNHVHLVVEYPPKISISTIAHALKGRSSFVARRLCHAELHRKLWAGAFWSPSFFAASCGGAPLSTLMQYVQNQTTQSRHKWRGFNPKFLMKNATHTHNVRQTGGFRNFWEAIIPHEPVLPSPTSVAKRFAILHDDAIEPLVRTIKTAAARITEASRNADAAAQNAYTALASFDEGMANLMEIHISGKIAASHYDHPALVELDNWMARFESMEAAAAENADSSLVA